MVEMTTAFQIWTSFGSRLLLHHVLSDACIYVSGIACIYIILLEVPLEPTAAKPLGPSKSNNGQVIYLKYH